MAAGLLMLRVVVGALLVGHGTQKLFGWFGGHGPRATGAFFELLGYRPGIVLAVVGGLAEAGGGIMLAAGLLTPFAAAAVVGVMLNAAESLRENGPWVINGGWEYTVVLATVAASLALTGPGSLSLDHLLGLDQSTVWGGAGLALGVVSALVAIVMRRASLPGPADADGSVGPVGKAA